MDKEALIKSIKQAIKEDFKTNSDVLETGTISLTDALNGATYEAITQNIKSRVNYDSVNDVGRFEIDLKDVDIKAILHRINTDKRHDYYVSLSHNDNELFYEICDSKRECMKDINEVIKDFEAIVNELKYLRDNQLILKSELCNNEYIIETIDSSADMHIDFISYLNSHNGDWIFLDK